MKTLGTLVAVAAILGLVASPASAAVLLLEDFEDTTVLYTASEAEFSDGFDDFWFNTAGPLTHDSSTVYLGPDGEFFNGMDLDGEGATLPILMDFNGIDISGYTGLSFGIDLAEDDDGTNQDWDILDFVHIDYQIDGGGYQNLLWIESIPGATAFNAEPGIDTDFDGDGDGTAITETFAGFTEAIAGTGSTLDIRITWQLDAGDEDLAIDNVSVTGVPEPATIALLGFGGLVLLRRRR